MNTAYGVRMINIEFSPLLGGAQMHTLRLCRYLRAQGVDAQVITRHYPGLAQHEVIEGVPVYRTPILQRSRAMTSASFTFYALRRLAAEREQVQIVHSHEMLSPMTIGLLASGLVGAKLVINPHRGGYLGDVYKLRNRRRLSGGVRLGLARRLGDAFVAISSEIAQELQAAGIPPGKIKRIPCALETDHYSPVSRERYSALRRALGLEGGPWVCFSGRLVEEKGVDMLLYAWGQVARRVPDARLLILGEGEERRKLEVLTRRLELHGHVRFAGGVADTAQYLQACDAYVQPSFTEGLPVAVLEAMACALPVVATAVGGVTDLMRDGENGRLVAPGDVAGLAERLVELLADAEARQALGASARQDIVTTCALEHVGQAHLEMYAELLASSGQSGS